MKSTAKDILRICKGHYDSEKYDSVEAALDAYYRVHYGVSKERMPVLSPKFMVELWLVPCVKTFVTPENFTGFCSTVLEGRFGIATQPEQNGFYEVLFDRLVLWLYGLPVRKGDEWIIDLSEYEGNVI